MSTPEETEAALAIANATIAVMSYKDGWRFYTAKSGIPGVINIIVVMPVTNTDKPESEKVLRVSRRRPIRANGLTATTVLQTIRRCIRSIEDHERDEHIVVNGERPYWPHYQFGERLAVLSAVSADIELAALDARREPTARTKRGARPGDVVEPL